MNEPGRMRLLNWFDGVTPAPHKEKRAELARAGRKRAVKDADGNLYSDVLNEFTNGVAATSHGAGRLHREDADERTVELR